MSKPVLDGMTHSQRYDHYEKRSRSEVQIIHRMESSEAYLNMICDMIADAKEQLDSSTKICDIPLTRSIFDDIIEFSGTLRELVINIHDLIEGDLNKEFELSDEARAKLKQRRGPMKARPGIPQTSTVARKPK